MISKIKKVTVISLIVIAVISVLIVLSPLTFLLNRDVKNFKVVGNVVDKVSGNPIDNAQIIVVNWYYGPDSYDGYSDREDISAVSDSNGNYSIRIERGAYMEIYIKKKGYVEDTTYLYPNKQLVVNFKLHPK